MNKYLNHKIWENPKILKHKSILQDISSLINVEIELSRICNQQCLFCYSHGDRRKDQMIHRDTGSNSMFPSKRLYNLIDELNEVGCKSIAFPGSGEPLLHKDIFKIIEKIYGYGMEIGLTTNFSKKLTDSEVSVLKSLSWIRCSLNASNKVLYDKIHNPIGNNSFDSVLDNLKRLRKERDILINISFVICEENKYDIENIYHLAMELGINSLSYRPDVSFNRNNLKYDKHTLDILSRIKKLSNDKFYVDIGLSRIDDNKEVNEDVNCYVSRYSLYITANGDIFPCCMTQLFDVKYKYDNIMNKNFVEFWNSDIQKNNYKKINMRYCPLCRHTIDNKLLKLIYNEDGLVNNFI